MRACTSVHRRSSAAAVIPFMAATTRLSSGLNDMASAPPAAVARLAEHLGLDPGVLRGYGKRAQTRSDHLAKIAKYLGWKTAAEGIAGGCCLGFLPVSFAAGCLLVAVR
jgi:hypothetical protein